VRTARQKTKGITITMVTDSDLEGFELVPERKAEKAGGVTISQIPAGLVALLKEHAPKALNDRNYELVLRVPVKVPAPPALTEAQIKALDDKASKARVEQITTYHEALEKAVDTVKQLALYSVAWGKGQDPKLYINKIPNRKDMPPNHARLGVKLDTDVAPENRPGRNAQS
jgi:hypothetical protein